MSIRQLKKSIKEHGKAKIAVALNLRETTTISNWLLRKKIPEKYIFNVKKLRLLEYVNVSFKVDWSEINDK